MGDFIAFPKPKRNEAYTSFVKRCFAYVKKNKGTVRGAYTGRGKNQKLNAPVVMRRIGKEWRLNSKKKK